MYIIDKVIKELKKKTISKHSMYNQTRHISCVAELCAGLSKRPVYMINETDLKKFDISSFSILYQMLVPPYMHEIFVTELLTFKSQIQTRCVEKMGRQVHFT